MQGGQFWRGHEYVDGLPNLIADERHLSEVEGETLSHHLSVVGDKGNLLLMKEKGLVRNSEVSRSWDAEKPCFEPLVGGNSWLRVVTEPRILFEGRATGSRVAELHLGDCLRGDLSTLGPLLSTLAALKILELPDNPNLRGRLELIRFSNLPLLEQVALQRTGVETNMGLTMMAKNGNLKYLDVGHCRGVKGGIPRSLLEKAGLRIIVEKSGMESEDPVGNEHRSSLRFKKRPALRPGT